MQTIYQNRLQFPRLLAAIQELGLMEEQCYEKLSEVTGLCLDRLDYIFEQAEMEWQAIQSTKFTDEGKLVLGTPNGNPPYDLLVCETYCKRILVHANSREEAQEIASDHDDFYFDLRDYLQDSFTVDEDQP